MFGYNYLLCICICALFSPSFCIFDNNSYINDLTGKDIDDYANIINLVLYKGSSLKDAKLYKFPLSQTSALKDQIDFKLPTTIYIHGFIESYKKISVETVVTAYLDKGKDNIIALDWSALSFKDYFYLVNRAKYIANNTAKALEELVNMGMDSNKLHIVGHSLGAQIAGLIGRYLNFTIPRITALDAAGPAFYLPGVDHINRESAHQVIALHTDSGVLGTLHDTGHIDFFANGGFGPQPGCIPGKGVICSHQRSWKFYAESVYNEDAFPAVECESYINYQKKKCDGNKILKFGYGKIQEATGTYYFDTNKHSLYSKAEKERNKESE